MARTARIGRWSLTLAMTAGLLLMPGAASAQASPLPIAVNDCWSDDNGDPVLDGVDFSPGAVDVTSAPATVDVTVTAHDTGGPGPASGVRRVSLAVPGGKVWETRRALTLGEDGAWHGRFVVPRGAASDWGVSGVLVTDDAGNETSDGTRRGPVVTTVPDTTPPELRSFTLSTDHVNTRARGAEVTITASATDDSSGVDHALLTIAGPDNRVNRVDFLVLARTAGTDDLLGVLRLPRGAPGGHRVFRLDVVDAAGNVATSGKKVLGPLGGRLEVARGHDDRTGPAIRSLTYSPALDVRRSGHWLMVRVSARDDVSGVSTVQLQARRLRLGKVDLHRVSGSAAYGVWQGRIRVPRCVELAGATAAKVVLRDRVGNGTHRELPITVRAADHRRPYVTKRRFADDERTVTFTFNEPVHGISTDNVIVSTSERQTDPAIIGTWSCRRASGASTDCLTGAVREATFAATGSNRPAYVFWQPEHEIHVLDRHGNPAYESDVVHQD